MSDVDKKEDKTRQLDAIGQETLRALLSFKTKTAAANALSIERQTLYDRIEKYGLDKFIAEIPKKAIETLQMGSERAAEVLVDALDERHNKMAAANSILDRVGVGAKQGNVNVQVNVTPIVDLKAE